MTSNSFRRSKCKQRLFILLEFGSAFQGRGTKFAFGTCPTSSQQSSARFSAVLRLLLLFAILCCSKFRFKLQTANFLQTNIPVGLLKLLVRLGVLLRNRKTRAFLPEDIQKLRISTSPCNNLPSPVMTLSNSQIQFLKKFSTSYYPSMGLYKFITSLFDVI